MHLIAQGHRHKEINLGNLSREYQLKGIE